jgi:hypothetical protein
VDNSRRTCHALREDTNRKIIADLEKGTERGKHPAA